MTHLLRASAVLMAIAGAIDPSFTTAGHVRARIAIVVQEGPTMALPAESGTTRRVVAERVRSRIAAALANDYDIQPRRTSDAAAAIVIGDSYPRSDLRSDPRSDWRSDQRVATVTVTGAEAPNVRILRVAAPRDVPAGTAIRVAIDAEGAGVAGQTSMLTVRASGLELARASHAWRGDRDRWHAEFEVVPVGEPPFVLRVEAQRLDIERTPIDNLADVVVDVRHAPLRVEVYEPRPSWATTFIRRALEGDARFRVASSSATSKSVATRTADAAALADATLDDFDVVVVGGLDRLTNADARALDRFMRARGGAVVLVPDAKVIGAAAALVEGVAFTERLSERPEKLAVVSPLAPIQASELLLTRTAMPIAERLAWTSGAEPSSVVVSTPHGDGRLVVSGALDAWRFRADDNGAFDRFWQSTIAGLALSAAPPIDVSVTPAIPKPEERGEIVVRVRERHAGATALKGPPHDREVRAAASTRGAGLSGPPAASQTLEVHASVDGRPIRLWPDAQAGVFHGSFVARETDGRSTVVVQAAGASPLSASRPVIVRAETCRPLPATTAPLSLLSASHHGIDVTPDKVDEVERFIRRTVTAPSATVTRRPMRSAWWMIPFAACLCGEWYLRRRNGAR